ATHLHAPSGVFMVERVWCIVLAMHLDSEFLSHFGLSVGRFDTELLGVLVSQPPPITELHRLTTSNAANGSSAQKEVQNIETNVPAGSTPRDETAIDVVPQRQARAIGKGFELPSDIVVLKQLLSVGSRHSCFQRGGRSHPGDIYRGTSCTQTPVDFKGSPLA